MRTPNPHSLTYSVGPNDKKLISLLGHSCSKKPIMEMGKSLLVRACCAFYASFKEFISLVDDNDDNAHCAGDDDGSD